MQEECKTLFLQTRNNMQKLYKELIVHVCGCLRTDHRIGTLTKDLDGWYNTYRYKFHMNIVKLANEFISLDEKFVLAIYIINIFIIKIS